MLVAGELGGQDPVMLWQQAPPAAELTFTSGGRWRQLRKLKAQLSEGLPRTVM